MAIQRRKFTGRMSAGRELTVNRYPDGISLVIDNTRSVKSEGISFTLAETKELFEYLAGLYPGGGTND